MPNQNVTDQHPTPKLSDRTQQTKKVTKAHRGRWLWLCFGLSGVAMISATAGALLAVSLSSTPLMQTQLSAEDAAIFSQNDLAQTNLRLPELTRPVNILVMGTSVLTSDLKDKAEEDSIDVGYHAQVNSLDGLSDVMLLVRFNPQTNKLNVLSIPRDTRTLIEGYGLRKINDANYFGGPALSAKAVSELLGGVRIDRYIRINVQGVEKLVDALGGVKLYVPVDMKYQDDSQHLYINLKQGEQHLDGTQALQFLRFRYDKLGDIGRIQRQQLMMRALMNQALNVKTIGRLPKILSVIQEHIDTNLSLEEIAALAGFAAQTEPSNVQMLMVPGEFSDPEEYKASYWLPNYERLDATIAEHFDFDLHGRQFESVDPAYLRVAIQDSTDDWEAVDELQTTLSDNGYWNVYVSSAWPEPLQVTRIVAQNGDMESAQALRDALGFGEVLVESTGSLRSDITIQLGMDWLEQQRLADESRESNQLGDGEALPDESPETEALDRYRSNPPSGDRYGESPLPSETDRNSSPWDEYNRDSSPSEETNRNSSPWEEYNRDSSPSDEYNRNSS
ncbi:LCP family protein, partial [Phormidium sp. CCY1219]|uniref:LCP family protein n=1 Tax=Phormidium sp. CCY1219 TaxID=2886104 RepID=UPI003FA7B332